MERKIPKMEDLKKVPSDEIVEAVIIEVKIQTWKEKIKKIEDTKFKKEDYDQEIVTIRYNYDSFIREETYPFFEKPMTTSKLGRFMVKYNQFPEVQQLIKVHFDSDSKAKIVIK